MAWAPDYITLDDLKAYARVDDVLDDVQLSLIVTAASRAVDKECRRQFGQAAAPEARVYSAAWDAEERLWHIQMDDLQSTVGVQVHADPMNDDTWTEEITAFRYWHPTAALRGRPYTAIRTYAGVGPAKRVRITGSWGWTAVPSSVQKATLLYASRLLMRRDSPLGVAGSPNAGLEARSLAKSDPDLAIVLRPFLRIWGVA